MEDKFTATAIPNDRTFLVSNTNQSCHACIILSEAQAFSYDPVAHICCLLLLLMGDHFGSVNSSNSHFCSC